MTRFKLKTFLNSFSCWLIASSIAVAGASSARAQSTEPEVGAALRMTSVGVQPADVIWKPSSVEVETSIRVESMSQGEKQIEIVTLPNGESFEIPVDLESSDVRSAHLTPEELIEARDQSREVLELTLRAIQSDEFNGEMVLGQSAEAVSLLPSVNGEVVKTINPFKRLFAFNHEVYQPMPSGMKLAPRMERFAQMAWQFIFVETLHAGINYYKQLRDARSRFNEYGLSFDLKVEPQIFIAKFNPTQRVKALRRNYAFSIEIAYSRTLHRVVLHTRLRREKGSGGLGLPALKAELKVFQSAGTKDAHGGESWYPVSPPLVSFVLDKSKNYFAQGITFGFNTGDLIPFSTLTNTFTKYEQVQDPDLGLLQVPQMALGALDEAAHKVFHRRPNMCSQLFG
jgi:hypothetical protein